MTKSVADSSIHPCAKIHRPYIELLLLKYYKALIYASFHESKLQDFVSFHEYKHQDFGSLRESRHQDLCNLDK